ncbi:uncharacterized protein [Amphiura filiformis]|uniref:uncharacterized protein isoform X2 n=1 Tax=Amphiura filiformis TaxID=82378 RepID=UPI003B20E170
MAHRWSWTFGLIIAIVSVFQTCRCETLRYSNCSEVQAADSVVIEAVGYPFFCSDVTYLGYKSCAEILQAGHQETGYYEIDPDGADTGVASFLVFCDMCKITSVISECPVDYLTFENSCYKIYTSTASRDGASSTCTAANSHLVDITSQEEQYFLAGKLNSQGSGDAWIGLSSQNNDDPLYWTDDSPLDFEAWDSYGRNDGGTCIRMNDGSNYRWGDKECSTNYRFVCEFELGSPTQSNVCTCNCDAQDGVSRSDGGWITDKQFLPVTELHFAANTKFNSEGLVTLGAFQCHGIDIPMLASCDELRSAGFNSSGWYDIDPDGPESPLSSCSVYCDMITGATVIHHDSEYRRLAISETEVAPDEASFRRPVTYKAPMTHIIALLESSLYCQQFIRWDCHNAPIWNNAGTQLTYWVSRDAEQMLNWGGANTGEEGCLCGAGASDACDGNPNYKCNCDADDDVWRYDEGLIIDSNKLPVTELRFGGINHYLAMGFYTLGPLECFGKSPSIQVLPSCADLRDAGHTRDGYYYVDPDGLNNGVDSFTVYCNMSTGTSIIGHNRADRGLIRNSAFDTLLFQYDVTFDQINALVSISSHCQQQLTYDCYGSTMWDITNDPYGHVGFWQSETGGVRYNFGIGTGLQGCPCSLDGSCANPNGYCNCDADDFTWRTDMGILTDKSTLPVAKIRFGDTNEDKEKGFYTLGKLECNDQVFSSCDALKSSGYVTDGYYEIGASMPAETVFCNMSQACPVYRTGKVFHYQYRFPEIPDSVTSIEFSVKAASNAYIALSSEPNMIHAGYPLYEIGIGTENNVKAVIRSCISNTGCTMANNAAPNMLSQGEHRDFYIRFQNGHIQVGRVGAAPFAVAVDNTPLLVKYVAFSTADNIEGEWLFPQFCNGFCKYGGIR